MKINTFDFETIPDIARINFLPEVKANGNLKDPVKIDKDIADKKKAQLDKMALMPVFAKPVVFGWHDGKDTNSLILEDESPEAEKKLLKETWRILKDYEQFVTFNGNSYDINVLLMRSMLSRVKPTVKISQKRYSVANHCDVRMVLGGWDQYAVGKLPYWSELLLGKTSKDEMSGDQVLEYWQMGLKEDISDYCKLDCQITFELYELLMMYYL